MNTPLHFRFLIDHVESAASNTPSLLFSDSQTFWDDLLQTCDRRTEKSNYWIFCTRWVRESLLEVMESGTARALQGVLHVLKPEAIIVDPESAAGKRRTIAHLLPILMIETLKRIETASAHRFGESYEDAPPSYQPGE
jgi:hypothetical protein